MGTASPLRAEDANPSSEEADVFWAPTSLPGDAAALCMRSSTAEVREQRRCSRRVKSKDKVSHQNSRKTSQHNVLRPTWVRNEDMRST